MREKKPLGPGQFSGVLDTPTARASARKLKPVRKRSELDPTLSPTAIKKLKETEKRYAASRRAAKSNGRDTFYD
jgi:hypothetical protein